tara:strand:- start:56 stop:355 length:300 start_codon:yes stop_codon:yes gene_type:complete
MALQKIRYTVRNKSGKSKSPKVSTPSNRELPRNSKMGSTAKAISTHKGVAVNPSKVTVDKISITVANKEVEVPCPFNRPAPNGLKLTSRLASGDRLKQL